MRIIARHCYREAWFISCPACILELNPNLRNGTIRLIGQEIVYAHCHVNMQMHSMAKRMIKIVRNYVLSLKNTHRGHSQDHLYSQFNQNYNNFNYTYWFLK